MKTFSHLWQYVADFFLEREMFEKSYRENQNTHFMYSNLFFPKIVPFMI